MRDKRQSENPRPSFLRGFWSWFGELPPLIKVVIVGAVVIGMIFAFLPKSLLHSFNCQVQNFPQNYGSSNGYFIDNQVIVVGLREDVDAVIGTPTPGGPVTPGTPPTAITLLAIATPTVPGTPTTPQAPVPTATATTQEPGKIILNPIEDCDLSYLNSRKDSDSQATVETGKLVMRLYEIPAGSTVVDIITEIGDKAQGRTIFADPNYLTRLADSTSDPCALPGDPGSGGGRPFGGPGAISHNAYNASQAETDFKNQWAFDTQRINLPNSSTFAYTGHGVRVGVFDTSPYRISIPFIKRVAVAFPSPLWFTNWDAGGTTMMSNHGLFVAGLIHRIAPKSRIQLVRVLNEDGCGQLWVLNKGLEQYKSRMSAWTGKLNKTVINMSLGIRVPEANGQTNQDLAKLANEDLGTLKKLIDESDQMGAIIVAATGNDSTVKKDSTGNTAKKVVQTQIPAAFPNVIGVVATNPNGERSCYSNKGNGDDVAAPGGDGGIDPLDPNNLCVSRAASWDNPDPMLQPCIDRDIANCKYGLISLAQTRYGPRYMLWSGTSFASPLVSGMAALAYGKLEKKQVICLIHGGPSRVAPADPDLGSGIINIGNNLIPAVIQQCPYP